MVPRRRSGERYLRKFAQKAARTQRNFRMAHRRGTSEKHLHGTPCGHRGNCTLPRSRRVAFALNTTCARRGDSVPRHAGRRGPGRRHPKRRGPGRHARLRTRRGPRRGAAQDAARPGTRCGPWHGEACGACMALGTRSRFSIILLQCYYLRILSAEIPPARQAKICIDLRVVICHFRVVTHPRVRQERQEWFRNDFLQVCLLLLNFLLSADCFEHEHSLNSNCRFVPVSHTMAAAWPMDFSLLFA